MEISQSPKALSALENKQNSLRGTYYCQIPKHTLARTHTHTHSLSSSLSHTQLYIFQSMKTYLKIFVARAPKQHDLSQTSLTHTK